MTDRKTWVRVRREMFDHLMLEVSLRWGKEPPEIRKYRQSYQVEADRPWRPSHRDELLRAAQRHQIILVGDFHALEQSQRTQLRVLVMLKEASLPIGIALECLPAHRQIELDAFLRGKISEKVFLRRVGWGKNWGFPWESYRPLLLWARENQIPVIALNCRLNRMSARDIFAARTLASYVKKSPGRHWIVLFGDLHLGSARLPKEIERVGLSRPLRIFQNVESVAFKLMRRGLDHQVDLVRYRSDCFAIQSVTPWVKWQSYLMWLDGQMEGPRGRDSDDVTDFVAQMVSWISEELRLNISTTALMVYTANDPDLWGRIRKTVSPSQRKWVELMIEDERSFYLSGAGWGYLARPSINHGASLAMQYIHHQLCGGAKIEFKFPRDFRRMIWIETVAYWGSKIVNPKRKSDTIVDLRSSLSSLHSHDQGRDALRLALAYKMQEVLGLRNSEAMGRPRIRPKHNAAWIAAAHLLGGLAGEKLYHGYRSRRVPISFLRSVLRGSLNDADFDLNYRKVMRMIEALPAPFRSKKERL